jgi:hypothetical protein
MPTNLPAIRWLRLSVLGLLCAMLTATCAAPREADRVSSATPSITPTGTSSPTPASTPLASTPPASPTSTPFVTPQPRLTPLPSGPELEQFAAGVSPLTGLPVQDAALLDLPAVLVSISNMPPTARPQAGLSFAPFIYELFIGEGTTRFMSVFYGTLPRRVDNTSGGCAPNTTIFKPEGSWIGRRVWLDDNQDGVQNPWESGVGGVCIDLLESTSGVKIASTSTDSNGFYAFDTSHLQAGESYTIQFKLSSAFQFTRANVGNDDTDSDTDPLTGKLTFTVQNQTDTSLNSGLILLHPGPPLYAVSEIAPERTYVGPIRSGRLTYMDFVHMYPASCLIYASAGNGIREQLKGCEIIFGEQPGVSPNTALLDVSHLKELAQKSKIANQPINYSGHLFDPTPPAGGLPASALWTYFHAYSQASWQYDPISGSYLRQTDGGDGLGVFHADTDRLTGRQLAFENVVIILADYNVFRHGQYDVALCCGLEGYAYIFRDGQMYKVRWSTNNRAWEQKSGLLRPLHFTGADKLPFALKPGRTWVSIMTTNSALVDLSNGSWKALFAMPNDVAPQN